MRIAASAFLLLSACGGEGISWGPVTYDGSTPPLSSETAAAPPLGGASCAEAVVVALGEARYAAWWDASATGSSVLMLARSPDGGAHWEAPVVADSSDAGGLRCARPLPSLFADESSEYLHVTYHISPRGSPGVYFTHSMHAAELGRSSSGVLHAPVAVTHGERPVRSSVAGRGDTVVVAFEDPNSARPRVLLAFSTGAGHAFSTHEAVSAAGAVARAPRVVLSGDSVRVHWLEEVAGGGVRAASRAGRLP